MKTWGTLTRGCAAAAFVTAFSLTAGAGVASEAGDAFMIGQRYNDGLDSRHAAISLAQSAKALGYNGAAYTNGRHSDDAWSDGAGSSIIGYFGHGGPGFYQTDEGATNASDQFISAGHVQRSVPTGDPQLRWWMEYKPFLLADQVRLAVLAACNTADGHAAYGDFEVVGAQIGVDAVVAFPDLVYYPSECTSCNYSGNYFWDRFSMYVQAGSTISTALSRSRTDLVASEGDAGGWGRYRITGSVAAPGLTRLKPAAPGEEWTSRPTGLEPYTLSDLHPVASEAGTSPMGPTVEVETTEGVSYRLLSQSGNLLDLDAPAAREGNQTLLSIAEAQDAAATFLGTTTSSIGPTWKLTTTTTNHGSGERLVNLLWRSTTQDGVASTQQVELEVDRRTGAVTYFADTEAPSARTNFLVNGATAVEAVRQSVSLVDADITVKPDVWNGPRWMVTVDRGFDGLVRDVDRLVIDGTTGAVLYQTSS